MRYIAIGLLSLIVPASAQYNSVRVVLYENGFDIDPDFLVRAKANGYNYVLGMMPLGAFETDLENAFERVDQAGLRLIPIVGTTSRWSREWTEINPSLTPNAMDVEEGHAPENIAWVSTPSAPNDEEMDEAFRTILQTVHDAFENADLSYSTLEYIHIGHDENLVQIVDDPLDVRLLVGYGTVSHSQTDRDYIDSLLNESWGVQEAFQIIAAQEVLARTRAVNDIFGNDTKVLMWADMWDPEANGGKEHSTYLHDDLSPPPPVKLAPQGWLNAGVATLPGMEWEDQEFVRDNLILMPWLLGVEWYGGLPYDPDAALDYFAYNGFKVIWQSGVTSVENQPLTVATTLQVRKYANAAHRHQSSVLGYSASIWAGNGYTNPSANAWKSIEYLRKTIRPSQIHTIINY